MALFKPQFGIWPTQLQHAFETGTFDGPFNTQSEGITLRSSDGTAVLVISGTDLVVSDGRTISGGTISGFHLDDGSEPNLYVSNYSSPPSIATLQAILDHFDAGFDDAVYNGLLNDLFFFEPVLGLGDDTHDDYFRGSPFADQFFGSITSDDFLDFFYEEGPQGVEVNIAAGTARDTFGNIDTISGIEQFRGSAHDDVFRGADELVGLESNVHVYTGGAGDDAYYGGVGTDVVSYRLDGGTLGVKINLSRNWAYDTHGDRDTFFDIDRILGSNNGDEFLGDGRDNYFVGYGGNDIINGGYGRDRVDYLAEHDGRLTTGHGVVVNLSSDTLKNLNIPGVGITTLSASSAYDTSGAIDRLWSIEEVIGTHSADYIVGNALDNLLIGNLGDDVLIGGDGKDELHGGQGSNTLRGGYGDDKLFGGGDSDALYGEKGYDSLFGYGGDDLLDGGDGKDLLNGGRGTDVMTGGADRDTFQFLEILDSLPGAARDRITDFVHGKDRIDLEAIDASNPSGLPFDGQNEAFTFLAAKGTAFSGNAGELIWSQEDLAGTTNDKTLVSGDVNGDGVADFQVELTGLVNLTASDFIL